MIPRMAEKQGSCEVLSGCDEPAVLRYPAMGGGHMRLCAAHGAPHVKYCERWLRVGQCYRWTDDDGRVARWLEGDHAGQVSTESYKRGYQAGYHAGMRRTSGITEGITHNECV